MNVKRSDISLLDYWCLVLLSSFMNQQINKYAQQDFSMINIAGLPDGIYQAVHLHY